MMKKMLIKARLSHIKNLKCVERENISIKGIMLTTMQTHVPTFVVGELEVLVVGGHYVGVDFSFDVAQLLSAVHLAVETEGKVIWNQWTRNV